MLGCFSSCQMRLFFRNGRFIDFDAHGINRFHCAFMKDMYIGMSYANVDDSLRECTRQCLVGPFEPANLL